MMSTTKIHVDIMQTRPPLSPETYSSGTFVRGLRKWSPRFAQLALGMLVMTLGICLVTRADIGTTPISTVPWVLVGITGMTFGQMTFAVNLLFVALQLVLLRRNFKRHNLLQIPGVFLFSYLLDGWMAVLANSVPQTLVQSWAMSLTGNLVMAIGIWLQMRSRTFVQPGEGIVMAVAFVTQKRFSSIKIANDVTLVALAAVLGWAMLGRFVGIGPGTLVSAVLVGLLIKGIDAVARRFLRLGPVR